ncbi:hypothetical protein KXD40_009585 [Peronospora effusa]|nr:hypothetical protein KXD40_009585 [Peronospora effusa]
MTSSTSPCRCWAWLSFRHLEEVIYMMFKKRTKSVAPLHLRMMKWYGCYRTYQMVLLASMNPLRYGTLSEPCQASENAPKI